MHLYNSLGCFPSLFSASNRTKRCFHFLFLFQFLYIFIIWISQFCFLVYHHLSFTENSKLYLPASGKDTANNKFLAFKNFNNKIIQLRATGQQQLNDNCWRITVNEEIDRPFFVLCVDVTFYFRYYIPIKLESRITNVFNGLTFHQHSLYCLSKNFGQSTTHVFQESISHCFRFSMAASTKERVNFFRCCISFNLLSFTFVMSEG